MPSGGAGTFGEGHATLFSASRAITIKEVANGELASNIGLKRVAPLSRLKDFPRESHRKTRFSSVLFLISSGAGY